MNEQLVSVRRFRAHSNGPIGCNESRVDERWPEFTVALMRPKEIHYYLLSLLVRGLGFWLLYDAAHSFWSAADSLYYYFFPTNPENIAQVVGQLYELVVKLIPAVYFIAGAPPFLKMATQEKFEDRD